MLDRRSRPVLPYALEAQRDRTGGSAVDEMLITTSGNGLIEPAAAEVSPLRRARACEDGDEQDRPAKEARDPVPTSTSVDPTTIRSRGGVALATDSSRSAPRATDFTTVRLLGTRSAPPRSGVRRVLYALSGGLVNLGPSRAEVRERELIERAKAPVRGCRRIAVMSRKGGVGKTTTTLQLGHVLAAHRGDRVIAFDGNPDAGSLADRVRQETTATITDLLRDRGRVERYADIRGYTSQAQTRLEVLAADDDPQITEALRREDLFAAVDLLERHYNLLLMDTGTGVLTSASKGIQALADQIIVVSGPSLDTARVAMSTLDWLAEHGHAELVSAAVVAINAIRSTTRRDLDEVERMFRSRVREVVRIPWDAALDGGGETSLDEIRGPTRDAYLTLAATVADGFGAAGAAAPSPRGQED